MPMVAITSTLKKKVEEATDILASKLGTSWRFVYGAQEIPRVRFHGFSWFGRRVHDEEAPA